MGANEEEEEKQWEGWVLRVGGEGERVERVKERCSVVIPLSEAGDVCYGPVDSIFP